MVLVDPDSRDIKVYLRRPGASISGVSVPAELRFTIDGAGRLIDVETGSVWSVARGIASEGPLKPESTEGGRRVSVLKRQEGAPVLLG